MSLPSILLCCVWLTFHVKIFSEFFNNFMYKMYSLLTIPQLKEELRKRNASTAGKKAVLIERLEAYDRNFNFIANPHHWTSQSDPQYQCPPTSSFRDVNADSPIPALNRQEIQSYFERFNTQPKGKALYEARCLLTARFITVGTNTYIQGQCKAQMKKLIYVVNVKLSNEGNIEQCHCECAAGSGIEAHCKHVSVLLCAVEDMVRTKTIILHQVCTQMLMNFKKPSKVFYKSPIQAQNLPSIRKKRRVEVNFDPLPKQDEIENYNDYVRNLAINFGDAKMPILQTFRPANPYGLEHDHTYSSKDCKEAVLESLLLKNVTKEQIDNVESLTRAQDKSSDWHEWRSYRITSSMFYVICHVRTGKKLLIEKILNPKKIVSRSIVHGKTNEPIAIKKYENEFNLNVEKCGLFICLKYPFLAASPDGLIGEETVVEVKCPYSARFKPINPVTVPYLELSNGQLSLKKNHPYYAQIQGQLLCTGRKFCNLIVYTFNEIQVCFINRDDTYIEEMVRELLDFYECDLKPEIIKKYFYKYYDSIIKQQ